MPIGKALRKDFPLFSRRVHGKRLAYLDSAATSQTPRAVLEAMRAYEEKHRGNPGRGVSTLSAEAGEAYEKAREAVAQAIGAKAGEIVFTRNTTESLNLLAYTLPGALAPERSRPVALSVLEHHSNLVPWQQMAKRTGRPLAFIPFNTEEAITSAHLEPLGAERSRAPALLSITHASNALGTLNDIAGLARVAHEEWDCPLVVDAAQSAPHLALDVRRLDCDFLAFSGHKMLGPMGIGVLYLREDWIERLPPFMTGGGQIRSVTETDSTWTEGPAKFEAGTPNVSGAVGLAEAMGYLRRIGFAAIQRHERALVKKTLEMLDGLGGIMRYGPPSERERVGVVSFNLQGVHAHDVGSILDRSGVQVRVGHHCAQPLLRKLGVPASVRASFYLYNDTDDLAALEAGLLDAKKVFA